MITTPAAAAVSPILVAIAGCYWDLRTRRIPNVLTFGAAAAAILFHVGTGGFDAALLSLAGLGVGLALFFPLFALGGMGAGDVKLLAAIGAWLGPADAAWTAGYAAIAGGVLGLALALARGYLRTAVRNLWGLLCYWLVAGIRPVDGLTLTTSSSPRLPYALPIAVGTLLTLWLH